MKLRCLPALLALATCLPASAQFAVYGKFDALRLNAATVGSAGQSVTWFTTNSIFEQQTWVSSSFLNRNGQEEANNRK